MCVCVATLQCVYSLIPRPSPSLACVCSLIPSPSPSPACVCVWPHSQAFTISCVCVCVWPHSQTFTISSMCVCSLIPRPLPSLACVCGLIPKPSPSLACVSVASFPALHHLYRVCVLPYSQAFTISSVCVCV